MNSDGNNRQNADVPETGRETVTKRGDYRTCWGLTVNIWRKKGLERKILGQLQILILFFNLKCLLTFMTPLVKKQIYIFFYSDLTLNIFPALSPLGQSDVVVAEERRPVPEGESPPALLVLGPPGDLGHGRWSLGEGPCPG